MLKNIADFQKTYSDPKRPKKQKSILRFRNFYIEDIITF